MMDQENKGPGETHRNTCRIWQEVRSQPHTLTYSDVFMRIRHSMLGIEWRTCDKVIQTGPCSQKLLSLKPTNLPLKSASKTLYNPFPPTPQPHLTLHPQSSHGPPSSNRFQFHMQKSLAHQGLRRGFPFWLKLLHLESV